MKVGSEGGKRGKKGKGRIDEKRAMAIHPSWERGGNLGKTEGKGGKKGCQESTKEREKERRGRGKEGGMRREEKEAIHPSCPPSIRGDS